MAVYSMLTESAIAKALLYFGAAGLGYMGLSKFCENAGIAEPLSSTVRSAIAFSKNLSREFSGPESERQLAAEMAARRAYAAALAENAQVGDPLQSNSPVTK